MQSIRGHVALIADDQADSLAYLPIKRRTEDSVEQGYPHPIHLCAIDLLTTMREIKVAVETHMAHDHV